jgi:DNA-binding IclR family transcriptional regulator
MPLDRGSAGRLLSDHAVERAWVQSVGEREEGVASVSAPVRDRAGGVVAAVSVSGPIQRTTRKPGDRYGTLVAEAAQRIEQAINT